jgi:hypothetical protein
VADIPKVPKDQFEAVIKALLNSPPKPLKEIQGKSKPKPQARKKK